MRLTDAIPPGGRSSSAWPREAVEWAVEFRRFRDASYHRLDRLLDRLA